MASRPAATPPVPSSAASHSPYVTRSADTCRMGSSQGGPAAGIATGGSIQPPRTRDAAIMIRMAMPIPAAATTLSPRAWRPGAPEASPPEAGTPATGLWGAGCGGRGHG